MESNNKLNKEFYKMKALNNMMNGWLKDTILDPALWITLIVSALISFFGDVDILHSVRVEIGSALIAMSGALLGIILAGLAIFVVLLDKKYIELIERVFTIETELWPFKWTAIIAILNVIFGMGLIIIGRPSPLLFRFILWGGLWSFLYLLCQIYELIRFLTGHAKTRAKQIQKEKDENKQISPTVN
jgi:hypothetical protein